MNLYLKTEKLDDIESVVASKEQQRLQDLLVFIEEYTNAESNISNALRSLSKLSDDWYLRVALNTKIDTIPEVLVHFRQHVGNTSSEEFFEGRLKTCQKHLALLDKWSDSKLKGLPRCNFYLQLAGAYYVQGHTAESVSWMRKAVLIDKLVLLRPSCLRYSLAMYFPAVIVSFGRWLGRLLSGEVRHESS